MKIYRKVKIKKLIQRKLLNLSKYRSRQNRTMANVMKIIVKIMNTQSKKILNFGFEREREMWEYSDGAVYLLREIS